MRHMLFIASVLVLVAVLFISTPAPKEAHTSYVIGDATHGSFDDVVCCTFLSEGKERTCAAPSGRSCDVCDDVCSQFGE